MVSSLYAVMAMVGFGVMALLFAYSFGVRSTVKSPKFLTLVFIVNMLFCLVDAAWGFVAYGKITDNVNVYSAVSMMFHIMASFTMYFWFAFTYFYLDYSAGRIAKLLISIPMVAEVIFVLINPVNHSVFYVDNNWIYHSGPSRYLLFIIQYGYLIATVVAGIIRVGRCSDKFQKSRYVVVIMYTVLLIGCGLLQQAYPNAPFYSIGCMVAVIIAFIGNILKDERKLLEEESDYYQVASKEIYGALEALAGRYVSIHLFDLISGQQNSVKSTPQIDSFISLYDDGATQIRKVMEGVVDRKYVRGMVDFVDLSTIAKRMQDKDFISHEFLGKNQGWCMSSFIRVASDADGNPLKVIHAVQNIDDVKKKEIEYNNAIQQSLETQNIIYAEMLRGQTNGVIALDYTDKIININDAAARMLGYQDSRHVPADVSVAMENIEVDNPEMYATNSKKLVEEGITFDYTLTTRDFNNNKLYVSANARSFRLLNGQDVYIISLSDITRNKMAEEELKFLSETDALTGIDNRRSGEHKILKLMEDGVGGMFCIIDVNKFKNVNDTYGHQVGDEVLAAIARCLKDSFRDSDIVMRLGGDEFALFVKAIDSPLICEKCMKKLFENVDSIRIETYPEFRTSISVGIAFYNPKEQMDYTRLYQLADSVMYRSKEKGGNCYTLYK